MNNILAERKEKNINDHYGIQDCWNKIINILSEDTTQTIDYLENCSKEEIYYISEIFEDISEILQSEKFITCLRNLDKKYPDLDMTDDIDLAESYIIG